MLQIIWEYKYEIVLIWTGICAATFVCSIIAVENAWELKEDGKLYPPDKSKSKTGIW